MPTKLEAKTVDPEVELSGAQRRFQRLAPQCSVEKRAGGVPQLAPQEKQMAILRHEMGETLLCIDLASKGQHAVRDSRVKRQMRHSIVEYESFEAQLRDERAQQSELDCLNYIAQKNVIDLLKTVPSQFDESAMLENAYNRLRRMENRLDLATKRFCVVNADNKKVREEIHRLLVERNSFNIQWKRTINTLVAGKEYLMDIFEIAADAFASREEWCRKLETLKWKGLYQLNKDIVEMQIYDGELNHLAKLEEFLRVKGTRRICEADEIEEMKRQEEIARCEEQIARHLALLEKIFQFTGFTDINKILKNFTRDEIWINSMFILLCETMQQSIVLVKNVEEARQKIYDAHDANECREEKQEKRISDLLAALTVQKERTQKKKDLNDAAEATFNKVLVGVGELVSLAKCQVTPMLSLLGNHKEVTRWNVRKFLGILELEVKSLIEIVYSVVKPPAPTPVKVKGKAQAPEPAKKIVADPVMTFLRPNRIESMVPYQPCAYDFALVASYDTLDMEWGDYNCILSPSPPGQQTCVEDYIMNLVFETPAVPADEEYIQGIFQLQDINTQFGIYTLTVPEKRHAYRTVTNN